VEENLDIVAYCYLEKRDLTINTFQVDMLKKAFTWDGASPFWFEDAPDLPNIQVTLKEEEYQGEKRIKVQWLNPYEHVPSVVIAHANAQQRREISNRLGSQLRATASPVAASRAEPSRASAPPPPTSAPPSGAPPRGAQTATQDTAWNAFCEWAKKKGLDDGTRDARWQEAIQDVAADLPYEQMSPGQWARIQAKIDDVPF